MCGLDSGDEPDVSIDSVVHRQDQAQRGRELLAFADSDIDTSDELGQCLLDRRPRWQLILARAEMRCNLPTFSSLQ